MAILTDEQKSYFKPAINLLWTLLIMSILFGLASKFLWSGYPPAISLLEPWFELTGIFGLAGAAILISDKNPLIK